MFLSDCFKDVDGLADMQNVLWGSKQKWKFVAAADLLELSQLVIWIIKMYITDLRDEDIEISVKVIISFSRSDIKLEWKNVNFNWLISF